MINDILLFILLIFIICIIFKQDNKLFKYNENNIRLNNTSLSEKENSIILKDNLLSKK